MRRSLRSDVDPLTPKGRSQPQLPDATPTHVVVRVAGAAAGVVLAHTLDYSAVFPNRAQRARELASTGHGYWHLAVVAGGAAALMAAAIAIARGTAAAVDGRSRGPALRPLDAVTLQAALFTGIEIVERVVAGHPWLGVVHERVFLIGLALQVGVGLLVAVVLRLLERLSAGIVLAALARRRRPARPVHLLAVRAAGLYRPAAVSRRHPSRAPPLSI